MFKKPIKSLRVRGTRFPRPASLRNAVREGAGAPWPSLRGDEVYGGARPEVPEGTISGFAVPLSRFIVCPELDYGLITLPVTSLLLPPRPARRAGRVRSGGFEEDRVARRGGAKPSRHRKGVDRLIQLPAGCFFVNRREQEREGRRKTSS